MSRPLPEHLKSLSMDQSIWERFFTVAPLVLVGSREANGEHNFAPKHLAMPLGWENHYCFVCSPNHSTYHNVKRTNQFTVSYPRPAQILHSSLAAAPRCDDQSKPSLIALPTFPAQKVDGELLEGGYLFLECELDRILDGFGPNSLILGKVIAAAVDEAMLREEERDDSDLLYQNPLLAYLAPGRLAEIQQTYAFPFPAGFSR